MTPPQLLEKVHPGAYVGEYVAPVEGSDTKVPVLDVYEGEIPAAARAALDGSDVHIYEFMPLPGDERDTTDQPWAVAAVEGIKADETGHVGADLTFIIPGPETSSHTDSRNPVLEGEARFGRLFEVLTRAEGVDHLKMRRANTNLTPGEMRMLGFSATSNPDVLRLDLPDDQRPAVAA
jgi:hypothetical protein